MLPQFAEGIPCIVEQDPGGPQSRIYFDISAPGFEEAMLAFYEEYLAVIGNPDSLPGSRFTTSRERAAGLYLLAERLRAHPAVQAAKGQVTGPFTMLTGIKDTGGRAGYYDATIRDMVIKGIALKAAWQTRLLRDSCGRSVLLFIDEPALAGLGSSAFISVSTDEIRDMINEVVTAVHLAGGLAGIHVCANTDWQLLLGSDIDILSFDAYGYFDRVAPLNPELNLFLDRGGIIAWGLVPTLSPEDLARASAEALHAQWAEKSAQVADLGIDRDELKALALITPACGMGALSEVLALKALTLTRELSDRIRNE